MVNGRVAPSQAWLSFALQERMKVEPEFEEQEDGNWIARMPDLPTVVGYGGSRHEAAVGLTVRGLHRLIERIESQAVETEDNEPSEILQSIAAHDDVTARLIQMIASVSSGKGDNSPNAKTLAAIEELESGGGESASNSRGVLCQGECGRLSGRPHLNATIARSSRLPPRASPSTFYSRTS